MRLDPKHRINPVFLEHHVPGGLVNLQFDKFEIIAQRGRLGLGIADGRVLADDTCVYTARDMRVAMVR
jgi:3-hydroxyacyl-[acyl-carrier protein] dehydratase / trans-2-decenoyl-[acyl-carrier protein] isomerase